VITNAPMFGTIILLQNITDILSSSTVNTNNWLPFISNNSFTVSICSVTTPVPSENDEHGSKIHGMK
jgi:hypothetical protein